MTTHLRLTAISDESGTPCHQDFYTYADGYYSRLISDLSRMIPSWVFGNIHSFDIPYTRDKGSFWGFREVFASYHDGERYSNDISDDVIGKRISKYFHQYFQLNLHGFIKIFMQYGSSSGWTPFCQENTGGLNDWTYYTPSNGNTIEENVYVRVWSKRSANNSEDKYGYDIVVNKLGSASTELFREDLQDQIKWLEAHVGISLELYEDDNQIILYIPFLETIFATYINNKEAFYNQISKPVTLTEEDHKVEKIIKLQTTKTEEETK